MIDERHDVEGALQRAVVRPAPAGLGERILGAALEARKNAGLAPWMRIAVLVCTVLIVAVLGADLLVGRQEAARMAALLIGPGVSSQTAQDEHALWAELGPDLGDADRFLPTGIALSRSRDRDKSREALMKALSRLKGMIDHEDQEILF